MNKQRQIAKVVRIGRLAEQGTDYAYWQQQSYWARLAALEELRREYYAEADGSLLRLQRVYTIVKLSNSVRRPEST
jgi:hypothetical protein